MSGVQCLIGSSFRTGAHVCGICPTLAPRFDACNLASVVQHHMSGSGGWCPASVLVFWLWDCLNLGYRTNAPGPMSQGLWSSFGKMVRSRVQALEPMVCVPNLALASGICQPMVTGPKSVSTGIPKLGLQCRWNLYSMQTALL